MSNKLTIILCFSLLIVAVLVGIVLYPRLPDPMPSHWNAAGQVDGYSSRFWGVFLLPAILVPLLLLFLAIPNIDPLKANIAKFRGAFNAFILAFTVYMLFVYALTLLSALGIKFNMTTLLLPAVGLLFIGIGFMMRQAKRNFFIGIRTPWTLSNDQVWDQTHKVGSWLFMLAGLVTVIAGFLGQDSVFVMLTVILLAAFVPVVYSYFLWRKVNQS